MTPARAFRCLVFLCPLALQAVEYRAQATSTWVENLSRTSFVPAAKDGQVLALSGTATHARQLAPRWTLIAGLDVAWESVPEFDALDHATVGARLTLRRKFGLGPMAPVLDVALGASRAAFRESGRSGWRSEASATVSKRLTTAWRVSATGQWEKFEASHAAFDTQSRRLGVEASWDASAQWRLTAGVARLWGQIVTNATGAGWSQALAGGFGPVVKEYYTRTAWEVSDTFGPGWVAYRVDGDVDLWWTGISYSLSEHTRIPLRYESAKVINLVGVRYDSTFWSLGLVHRF